MRNKPANRPARASLDASNSNLCAGEAPCACKSAINRRDFIRWSSLAAAGAALVRWPAIAGPFAADDFQSLIPADKKLDPAWVKSLAERGTPTVYQGAELEKIGMPIGGIGAGQLYLGGDGRLWHWDIFNLPQPPQFSDTGGPNYARPPKPQSPIEQGFAIQVLWNNQTVTRTLDSRGFNPGHVRFRGAYPIGLVDYADPALPLTISLEAFSPFIPLDVENSSLPATLMRFKVKNTSAATIEIALGGWIENAVCLGSGRPGLGQRRNRVESGRNIRLIHSTAEALPVSQQAALRDEIVFETFENGYGIWSVSGDAFGTEPAAGTLRNQNPVTGFQGQGLVNTFRNGDATRGRLTSKPFPISRRYIAFLIGGGGQAERTCMNLRVDGRIVRTATGHNDEKLEWADWEVSEFEGQSGVLEIIDDATGGWGHINIDQILFTDQPPSARIPLTGREDYGSLALAVLEQPGASFARAGVPDDAATALFSAIPAPAEVTAPFGRKLIGAVGRKVSIPAGSESEVTFVVAVVFPRPAPVHPGPVGRVERVAPELREAVQIGRRSRAVCRGARRATDRANAPLADGLERLQPAALVSGPHVCFHLHARDEHVLPV